MKPEGVASGQLLVYSKLSPGPSIACSPATPGPAPLWQPAEAVADPPMAAAQLHRLQPDIFDAHVIGPDVMAVGWRGVLVEIERPDRDFNRAGRFGIHG